MQENRFTVRGSLWSLLGPLLFLLVILFVVKIVFLDNYSSSANFWPQIFMVFHKMPMAPKVFLAMFTLLPIFALLNGLLSLRRKLYVDNNGVFQRGILNTRFYRWEDIRSWTVTSGKNSGPDLVVIRLILKNEQVVKISTALIRYKNKNYKEFIHLLEMYLPGSGCFN